MGTRGVIGTLKDGVLHASYQQYDTYPSGTGADLQRELKAVMEEEDLVVDPEDLFDHLAPLVDKMTYVEASEKPTREQADRYSMFLNRKVSTGDDWYAQLREQQGSLMKRLNAGIATESTTFIKDSLFCEWGYIFDFDARKVLILRGFNHHEDKQWEHARLDEAGMAKAKQAAERVGSQPYLGVSAFWTGTMEEFLNASMEAVEALEVDA